MIFLYQQRDDEACACLIQREVLLDRTIWRRELIQTRLHLAACEQASHHEAASSQLLENVHSLLKAYPHYLQVVQLEVKWLPALCKVVSRLSQLAHLRELLSLEPEIQRETATLQASTGLREERSQGYSGIWRADYLARQAAHHTNPPSKWQP
jgi:hypothetical protein